MKTTILIFTLCTMATTAGFAQQSSNTADEGVIINGVRWATRNVAVPGTFAEKPEDAGMFYQWNRKKAWNAIDKTVENWDSSMPKGTEWEKANDPSPSGWRVPTYGEIQKLFYTDKVSSEWTTQNGMAGIKFTDKASGNSIFLPAAGYREDSDGTLNNAGSHGYHSFGYYWSSTRFEHNMSFAYYLRFNDDFESRHADNRSYGHSLRCVAE